MQHYYSQYGEDYLLWKLFDCKETGIYVDVGAFDGVYQSNTFSFEQQGWSGICIEPHPRYFQLCEQARSQATCLNVACVSDDDVHSIEFHSEELGLFSGIRGDREEVVRLRYEKLGRSFKGFDRITVLASTLNTILIRNLPPETEIDFISIDVEGTELEVLRGLDLSRFRPSVIVVDGGDSRRAKESLDAHLLGLDYIRAGRVSGNVFYVRDLRDTKKLRSISIDCRIERILHPLGEEHTLPRHKGGVILRRRLIGQKRQRIGSVRSRIKNVKRHVLNIGPVSSIEEYT